MTFSYLFFNPSGFYGLLYPSRLYFVYSVKLYMYNQLSQNYPPLPLSELYQVSIYTWDCFWAHYFVPLLYLSISKPVLHFLNFCKFIILFDIW